MRSQPPAQPHHPSRGEREQPRLAPTPLPALTWPPVRTDPTPHKMNLSQKIDRKPRRGQSAPWSRLRPLATKTPSALGHRAGPAGVPKAQPRPPTAPAAAEPRNEPRAASRSAVGRQERGRAAAGAGMAAIPEGWRGRAQAAPAPAAPTILSPRRAGRAGNSRAHWFYRRPPPVTCSPPVSRERRGAVRARRYGWGARPQECAAGGVRAAAARPGEKVDTTLCKAVTSPGHRSDAYSVRKRVPLQSSS